MQWIKQGDAMALPVEIKLQGQPVDIEDIELAEFYLGPFRKTYPGQVEYRAQEGLFYVPLNQQETLALPAGAAVPADLRVKFTGGDVLGTRDMEYITVYDAISREVL